ncbi:MAG TPA: orotidine-5'-phosphate decarboxylase [Spongiibacteraceae bacterium]|nr:orotidine-5'-phosphate decarboxylase [Spongiibacteraceae bacterium]HCS27683.1 orotidine-5'-phosphate decarboxylase [Spongiibacteraceae bacterium]
MSSDSPIIVALDFPTSAQALGLAELLDPALCRVKVGKELFTREGPVLVKALTNAGFEVFLDLKFHDIPNTVAAAVRAAAELGVWMVNVHASGGPRMMDAAREALQGMGSHAPLLTAVTVLTSMEQAELTAIGVTRSLQEQVEALAGLAKDCGLDGVVCSANEAGALRKALGNDFLLVTPGIRPANTEHGDQRRVASPREALEQGSDYLVIGRPITRSEEPLGSLRAIAESIASR